MEPLHTTLLFAYRAYKAAMDVHGPALIAAAQTLAKLREGESVEGWKLVPVEPTQMQRDAAFLACAHDDGEPFMPNAFAGGHLDTIYRAMLSTTGKGS
jgi:hypothetical protein